VEELIAIPLAEYEGLKNENETFRIKIQELEQELALLKGSRDSRTSSTSPSQDLGRSNSHSLRTPGCRKSGGQPGHPGHCLQLTDSPDEIIDHIPAVCTCCGQNLEGTPIESHIRRQTVDIPPVRPVCTEHRSHLKTCPSCGTKNKGVFPGGVTAPVQYGPAVKAVTAYMSVYQYIPYNRIVILFRDCFGLHLSEGCVDNFLQDMSDRALPAYEGIRERIHSAPVVGADETGCRVNGRKHWFHVWQTCLFTFIVAFARRSHEVVETYFPGGFIHSFQVSDCNASQLKTPARAHQLCIVHLLRELLNFEKSLGCKWSILMKEFFHAALELKKGMTPDDYLNPPKQVAGINEQLDELLKVDCSGFHKKEQAFIKRLVKHRESILVFLAHEKVPPTNNATESAIRNVKVKTKVSGQFRNSKGKGADRYARLRSVIDTTIKHGQDVYAALINLAYG
jgi:transposase